MRKKIKKNTVFWTTFDKASKVINTTSEWLYKKYIEGSLLPVYPSDPKYAIGCTWNELNELYPGIQKNTARRKVAKELYIGFDFRDLAEKTGNIWFRNLSDIAKHDKWFDGTVYIAEQCLYRIKEEDLRLVCARAYRYNELIKRYRPRSIKRHVVLCVDERSTRAKRLKTTLDKLYPGVVLIAPIFHVFTIKEKNYESK